MKKYSAAACLTVLIAFFATQAFAGTTGWFNFSDDKIREAAFKKVEKNIGNGTSYTRIQCKLKDGAIWLKLNYSYIFSDGTYGYITGSTDYVDRTFASYKKRGASVRSRTDLTFKNGTFTCMTWYRGD